MGFRLAIDDFGTGYSSFSYLKRMPVNTIKIDKSFVLGMLSDNGDTAIVRTSVELAHHLGLQIVAEGVETAELLESLTGIACDSAQGYFLSRPLTSDALIDWVRHSSWGLGAPGRRVSAA
jgi:EAL domain-containing protein (putative c-di-GMP-specific phosphodiesterase class I)